MTKSTIWKLCTTSLVTAATALSLPSAGYAADTFSSAIYIVDNTNANKTSLTFAIDFVSSAQSKRYYDYESVLQWNTNQTLFLTTNLAGANCQSSPCTGDTLYMTIWNYATPPMALISKAGSHYSGLSDYGGDYSNVTVSVTFYINGACYTDWEYLSSWPVDVDETLYLNTSNAQWSDGCYRGDFLHH